jgi:hypothetical protein
MKMPGFNADASLYRSAGNYRMRATGFSAVVYSSVMSQQTISPNSLHIIVGPGGPRVAHCEPWFPVCVEVELEIPRMAL